jgi:chemotaxis family two-component system response regulator Rcp1
LNQPGRRILLVEDSVGDARLIREALEDSAIPGELVVITNGQRAIEFIDEIEHGQSLCPHLAIIDLNLPKRPGAEVVKRMRASVKCKHVPVVVLTSSDNKTDREIATSIGVSRYILKPARLAEILQLGAVFREMLGLPSQPVE